MENKNNLSIPAAILLAGFLIAGGIYLSNRGNSPVVNNPDTKLAQAEINFKPVSATEHIKGNPDAPVTIVEFSDTECPFCKMFQTTMQSVIDTYGKDGKVAWVYRHFPLDNLHPKTRKEAEATECANELGGNTAFWKVLDAIYANTPANNGLDASKLPEFAESAGIDVTKFNSCLSSGKHTETVEAQFQDGVMAGAQGTPYSVMVLKSALSGSAETDLQNYILKNNLAGNMSISADKKSVVMNGALPVNMVKAIIDIVLK